MAGDDKKHRDSLKVTDDAKDDAKAPPRDRDQSAISPQRAHDVADRAEYSNIPGAQDTDDPGEGLLERDHVEDPPSAREQPEREKPVAVGRRGPAKPH
jgi:hypothetical protein